MQADAALLAQLGRNAFLAEMKIRGLDLDTRSKLADFLDAAAIKDGNLTLDLMLRCKFEAAAAKMPPIVKSLLVENGPIDGNGGGAALGARQGGAFPPSAREADAKARTSRAWPASAAAFAQCRRLRAAAFRGFGTRAQSIN